MTLVELIKALWNLPKTIRAMKASGDLGRDDRQEEVFPQQPEEPQDGKL